MEISQIVERLQQGDSQAQAYLYTKYKTLFTSIAYKYTSNWEDAEDVTAEAFIRIFKYINQLSETHYLMQWCVTVVKSVALNFIKKRKREESYDDAFARNKNYTLQRVEDKLDLEIVQKKINELSEACRTVLHLAVIEDLPGAEIAKKLNIHKITTRSHLHNARKLMKKKMKENVVF